MYSIRDQGYRSPPPRSPDPTKVALGRLDGRMPQQEFDLFPITVILTAEFRASPAKGHERRSARYRFAAMPVQLLTRLPSRSECPHYLPAFETESSSRPSSPGGHNSFGFLACTLFHFNTEPAGVADQTASRHFCIQWDHRVGRVVGGKSSNVGAI